MKDDDFLRAKGKLYRTMYRPFRSITFGHSFRQLCDSKEFLSRKRSSKNDLILSSVRKIRRSLASDNFLLAPFYFFLFGSGKIFNENVPF